ncbi:paired small multidrug resistance pump [Bhargavaea ginsengi]|uniref:Paired small multidrug resistance pump n=1 Tax=Bhargavaea ginsengi TaxID=426757 RepID=A0A1H6TIW0_9BACL|nr:multidrug efflux SMR transporter [Bhargavaea ginsengi]SEI76155.1 paired small multidrug resistance pump [Bhargavaea ginsengi]
MAWVFLALASLGEIFGVMFINMYLADKKWWRLIPLVLSFGLGFVLLSLAMREIPMGTAYAIWTGLGAAGAVLIGILFFREPAGWKRLLFISFIIAGAACLKLFS